MFCCGGVLVTPIAMHGVRLFSVAFVPIGLSYTMGA